jgi:hypothetical protein
MGSTVLPIRVGDVTISSNSSGPLFQKVFVGGEPEFSKVIRRSGVTGDDGMVFQNTARIFIGWCKDIHRLV